MTEVQSKTGQIVHASTRSAGVNFGTRGIVIHPPTGVVLASTRLYPYGMTGPALQAAIELAATVDVE